MSFPNVHVLLQCTDKQLPSLVLPPESLACFALTLPEKVLSVGFLCHAMFSIFGMKGKMFTRSMSGPGLVPADVQCPLSSLPAPRSGTIVFVYVVEVTSASASNTMIPSTELEPPPSLASSSTGFSVYAHLSETSLPDLHLELGGFNTVFDSRNEASRQAEFRRDVFERDESCRLSHCPPDGADAAHLFKATNPDMVRLSVPLQTDLCASDTINLEPGSCLGDPFAPLF